ncbi:hypothetical protein GLAREA_10802 [Glarea lozoyensis ATCC 20868]|uniref:Sec39 domain-containing protein n=1 Tax=Glarea lozoyensis (strain ATCC 20868 / MF5171) TaxID=1116229 RepID=S3DT03_GLAL2|nr:uncharacterized protein GLAREA_10802 [Glarea lozoyensis ATCC 20868]EPE35106.1 hypothetical protein GLAREA_10802 [Glarea lozoyensis ATCC 20868]
MARPEVSPAKIILLAVQLATSTELSYLESLVSRNQRTLHLELVLRILLSYLPETLPSAKYVPFLQRIGEGNLVDEADFDIKKYQLDQVGDEDAKKKARKLHLRSLSWPYEDSEEPTDLLVRFLLLRSLAVDESTGMIDQLPELLSPFLHQSTFLRTWMISTILPLVRFNYEFYPDNSITTTLPNFESLDHESCIKLLLSRTSEDKGALVGRDIRGLVGPYMYGDSQWKRRKTRRASQTLLQNVTALNDVPAVSERCIGWEDVFNWIITEASSSWENAVEAIEKWDGPGDIDLGDYGDGSMWLDENEQQYLERRYARAATASAYLVPGDSEDCLNGIQRILIRLTNLLDLDRITTLQAAASLLSPVTDMDEVVTSPGNAKYLRNDYLSEANVLTAPGKSSVRLLHALLVSTYLCTRAGSGFPVKRAAEFFLLQDERDQKSEFNKLISSVRNGPKGDEKYWIRLRNEVLWLRSWGCEELSEGTTSTTSKGIFGALSTEYVETELLKVFLSNTQYTLARSIYDPPADPPLSKNTLIGTIIAAAMNAYDNATNANKTRGGLKKAQDTLQAFPDALLDSLPRKQLVNLIDVTHELGKYRLVFRQGEPFQPVTLRVHGDPISIIGKVLDQNPKSYLKIVDLLSIGKGMVRAGLTARDVNGSKAGANEEELQEQESIAEKRIVSMCIDAACVEDDFETAYSYVITRLNRVAGPAQSRTPAVEKQMDGLCAEAPPRPIDDWSWRAALQAGKYRRTDQSNGKSGSEVRHLEQRLECLSQALRLAPKSTLGEILNVFRRCEEELVAAAQQETEEAEAWDARGDHQTDEHEMPGGFGSTPARNTSDLTKTRAAEEAPMSLFDLSRASMARAQNGFSALSMLRGSTATSPTSGTESRGSLDGSRDETGTPKTGMRKRDQLKSVAVGGLASGVGWLIGAPSSAASRSSDEYER